MRSQTTAEFTVNGVTRTSGLGRRRLMAGGAAMAFIAAVSFARPARADAISMLTDAVCNGLADQIGKVYSVFYESNTLMNGFDTLLGADDASGTIGKILDAVKLAQSVTIKPIAAAVLALALLLQLLKIAQRADANAQMPALREVLSLFVFCACYLYVIRNCNELASGVYSMARSIAWQFSPGNGRGMGSEALGGLISASIDESSVPLMLGLLAAWFSALGAVVAAIASSYARGLEIYLLTLFAPLALAFLALDETRQWGVGFIKSFCAACLSATVILFFMWVCPYLLVGTAITADGWLVAVVRIIAVGSLITMGVTKAGSTAREVLGG